MTECTQSSFPFASHFSREVVARFDGGQITSDAGAMLLREVEQRTGIMRQFAACFRDHRNPDLVEHTVAELVRQRMFGLALGYEDLNDHDTLRHDPLLAVLVGKSDPTGDERLRTRDRGKPLAGKSTLNRLELDAGGRRCREPLQEDCCADQGDGRAVRGTVFAGSSRSRPRGSCSILTPPTIRCMAINWDGSFTAIISEYCFLPLYLFCGEHLLGAWLRPANIDGAPGR